MIELPFTRADLNLPPTDAKMPRRGSISGVQSKVLLKRTRGRFEPTEQGGEYILKPVPGMPIPRFGREVPVNEYLTMEIAKKVFGIAVAEHTLARMADGEYAYMTRRFDYRDGVKIPQEDFCQLMNRSEASHGRNYKYDASYEECAEVVSRFCPAGRIELRKLFFRIMFNYAMSNGDAHLKNFSLYASPLGDYVLTPAYDLLATSIHFPEESALALAMFADGHYTPAYEARGFYSLPDFVELGGKFGVVPEAVAQMAAMMRGAEAKVEEMVEGSALSAGAKVAYLDAYRDRVRALSQM